MKSNFNYSRIMLIASMCIFGTIGIIRRYIPLPSSVIALVRGIIGALFLITVSFLRNQKLDRAVVRKYFPYLALSGIAIGFNWILLFEAYNHATVATATLCYYLAPILVILASPIVLKEALTLRKGICAAVALCGMVLVSGIAEAGFSGITEIKGILLGLGAAVLYAFAILMNKKMPQVNAYDKTIVQLSLASAALLPYVLLTENILDFSISPLAILLLFIAGILHTGIAYWLYFGSIGNLTSQTVALMSYIDPILAIFLSMIFLQEPMSISSGIGAVMILGATYISEK